MLQTLLSLLLVMLHTVILYVVLILALSLVNHRQISELSVSELVIITVLGSAVETALVAGNKSLLAGLVASATLLVSNHLFTLLLRRSDWLKRAVIGKPIPLVYEGLYLDKGMREAGINKDDVLEGLRQRGYEKVEQVHLAVMEIDGEISVVPKKKEKEKE